MFANFYKLICKEINNYLKFEIINTISENDSTKVKIYLNELIIKNINKEKNIIGFIEKNTSKIIFNGNKREKNTKYYILSFTSLDGTLNFENQLNCGSIFGIYEYDIENEKILNIVSSCYCIYGINTICVYSENNKLNINILTGYDNFIKIDKKNNNNKIYSINNLYNDKEIDFVIRYYKTNNYKFRYSGCLVVDIHNILFSNGIFYYPENKIHLLCQSLPIAYLFKLNNGICLDSSNNNIFNIISILKNVNHSSPVLFMSKGQDKIYLELLKSYEINKY